MTAVGKILFVDDEPNVLQGYQRQLRKLFQVDTAEGALNGLQAMEQNGPYAVVVTDMRMPSMNGVEFLRRVRKQWPETTRLMLTGNVDQQTAIDAVNDGCVFRFLNKPCSTECLSLAVTTALEQYSLVTAERELLSKTLNGSINLLAEILSLLNPTAFGRTATIRRVCNDVCARLELPNAWEVSMAASLALIGCITVPEHVLTNVYAGMPVTSVEKQLFDAHPLLAGRLIEQIPRLERVAEIIRRQNEPFVTTLSKGTNGQPGDIGIAVSVLKTAIDFERYVSLGASNFEVIVRLQSEPDHYSIAVVKALSDCVSINQIVKSVNVAEFCEGMILDENLVTSKGELLLARGNEISAMVRERLICIAANTGRVKEPVRVVCRS